MARPNRPYRVGMARSEQRYIEPDAIYPDMRRGAPTSIPRQFPFTWTPVNGYRPQGGLLDDAWKTIVDAGTEAGQAIIKDGEQVVKDRSAEAVEDVISSTPGQQFLDAVKAKAAEGVTDVVKQNGMNLILLAVAGGAVGGAFASKTGKLGTIAAVGVAGWAAMQILNAVAPAPAPKKK